MKLLLYGIGRKNIAIENNIKKEHEIIGYTDSYAKLEIFHGRPFFEVKEIPQISFDYLIITMSDRKVSLKVKETLIKEYQIPENKIIPYSAIMETQHWKIKSRLYDSREIRGIILGNSHAAYGFLEDYLEIPFMNLAIPSQDIFCSCATMDKLLEMRLGVEKKCIGESIQFIVFDLYDYVTFNVDTSQLSVALNYIRHGGMLIEHNYMHNKNGSGNFVEDCRSELGILVEKNEDLSNEIFINDYDGFQFSNEQWWHIENNERITWEELNGDPICNIYDATIQENKTVLNSILNKMVKMNPDIKIVFTLIPRYKSMEEIQREMVVMKRWKKYFEKYVAQLCRKYSAIFLNYKYETKISENHMFYGDPAHLNTSGAMALTSILNQDLNRIVRL